MHPFLKINPKVKSALEINRGVVALESTIIAHGMPYPDNMETALMVEKIILDNGAIPATIAVLDGKMTVGLSHEQIQHIAQKGQSMHKASRRDLPWLFANGLDGATTVAATMIGATWAGIRIFATGGIGGVHRGAGESMDVSADLEELAYTNVAVVCAGAKSILDIGLTLEYLETKGVPVIGYQTKTFPAFYTRDSGFDTPFRCDTPDEIARILHAKWGSGLQGGVVIGQPVQKDMEADREMIRNAITEALARAKAEQISGKALSPYLLALIEKRTGGKSLKTNIALVCNNAMLAARIASGR